MKKIILVALFCLLFSPGLALALVNINTAGLEELKNITGVGDVIAQNIIDYRNTNGPFKKIEDIINVSRIGDATFLKMKDQITVGFASVGEGPGSGEGEEESNAGISEEDDNEDSSSNTNQSSPGNYSQETFKVGAGRERLATVRTPILFSASQNKKGKDENNFTWSFGDGTSASGQKVYHTYQFPGRYNVVLNGSIDKEEDAVARTIVVVVDPKIKVTAIDLDSGFVEITNDSDKEQNLNGWILKSEIQKYVFPVDTIISPKASIKIPLGVIGFTDKNIKEISLSYPDGGIVSGGLLSEGVDLQKVAELKKQIAKIKQQMANPPETSSRGAIISARGLPSGNATKAISGDSKNVVILRQEPSWFEKIKNAIFK